MLADFGIGRISARVCRAVDLIAPVIGRGHADARFERPIECADGAVADFHRDGQDRLAGLLVASATDAANIDGYRRMEEAGVTHLATLPWIFYGGKTESLQDKKDGMRRFADDVIGKMG